MARPKEKFAYLPQAVVESAAYASLRTRAAVLLSLIAARYNGHNNGDLSLTYNEMHDRWGWARDTTARAYAELQEHGLLVQTRKGGQNRCSLYALGWLPVSNAKVIEKLDRTGGVSPTKATNHWRSWPLKCVS